MGTNSENGRGPPPTALLFSLAMAFMVAVGVGWYMTHRTPLEPSTSVDDASSGISDVSSISVTAQAEGSAADSSMPPHNYVQADHDAYVYASADHSDNGGLIRVRYLGEQGGVYSLQVAGDQKVLSCTFPCAEVREWDGNQIVGHFAFSDATILGAAFTDAFNGELTPTPLVAGEALSGAPASAEAPQTPQDPG